MNEFSKWYIALLQKQVAEEVEFLVANGHNDEKIYIKCPFCQDSGKGYYQCKRLQEITDFAKRLSWSTPYLKVRRKIGCEPDSLPVESIFQSPNEPALPLLSIKL